MQEMTELLKHPGVNQTGDSLFVANIIKDRTIKCFVEIGSSRGGSLAFYSYCLPEDCIMVGIDNRGVVTKDFFDIIKQNCSNVHIVNGNSHDVKTYDIVVDIIEPHSIDFLHIDGDHTFEGVSADFNDYYELVSDNGIIVVHDIRSEPGVKKLWEDIKFREFDTEEVSIPPLYTNIGIVYKKKL